MRKNTKKKHKKILNKKLLIIFLFLSALLGAAIIWYLKVSPAPDNNGLQKTFTYSDCVAQYGTDSSKPPRCHTSDSREYTEFKTKGQTYDECVNNGGKIIDDGKGCTGNDRKYIQKFPEVSNYNDCRDGYPQHQIVNDLDPYICIDKNGLLYFAGSKARRVNDFIQCVRAGGVVLKQGTPKSCYYDGVVYWQVLEKSHKYLNPPYELKTYKDCLRFSIKIDRTNSSCKAWNGITYVYDGPPVTNYEECLPLQGPTFLIPMNPPVCIGPDGTKFVGP